MLEFPILIMATEYLSEDIIRDKAKYILGFEDSETAVSGVGQLTSWKSLGLKNVQGAPDGWYPAFNNGITAKIGNDNEINAPNTITVSYNGSVGQSFFQTEPYWATDDVNILTLLFKINKYIALFFTSIIRHVGQNYAFVDKWVIETMRTSLIKLPVNEKGEADFEFMENFIKSLPYGKYI